MTRPAHLSCLVLLGVMAGGAQAVDAARGAQLYMRTDDGGRSCVSCHGPDPGLSQNNILRAAGSPDTLTKVLNTVSAMGFLRSRLSDADRADITAFLASINALNDPASGLRMWPVTLDFGTLAVGATSPAQTVRLANLSLSAPLALASIGVSGTRAQLRHDCPAQLAPGGRCDVQVTMRTDAPQLERATLSVTGPALGTPVHAGVAALGTRDAVSALAWESPATAVAFNPATPRKVVALANPGPMPAVLALTSITGPNASQFRIEGGCAQGQMLVAGTRCELTLAYTPGAQPAQAVLQLRSDQGNPASLSLEGAAAAAAEAPAPPDVLAAADSGGGCTAGPPGKKADPTLWLAALLAAAALLGRSGVRPARRPR